MKHCFIIFAFCLSACSTSYLPKKSELARLTRSHGEWRVNVGNNSKDMLKPGVDELFLQNSPSQQLAHAAGTEQKISQGLSIASIASMIAGTTLLIAAGANNNTSLRNAGIVVDGVGIVSLAMSLFFLEHSTYKIVDAINMHNDSVMQHN